MIKRKVKFSKNFTLLYTCDLYTKEPIYLRPYQGNMLDYYVEDFGKDLHGEKLLINAKELCAITELLEQNREMLSSFCH
ncbi:hypothetical protein HYE14_02945 [Mycoplasmopsis bovis]|nr:hypothetical protein [Mycoplasmopsis bovis]QQH25844.1 hypothetical protein HYE14_02945 [Mycoplasmopsis bovis]